MKSAAILAATILLASCGGSAPSSPSSPTQSLGGLDWSVVDWSKFPGLREQIESAYRQQDCDRLSNIGVDPKVNAADAKDKAGILSIILTMSLQLHCVNVSDLGQP